MLCVPVSFRTLLLILRGSNPPGREHEADANGPAHPSLCTQPIFHAALAPGDQLPGGVGYISGDGHHFSCRNPALLQQAFHVCVLFLVRKRRLLMGIQYV